VPRQVGHNPKEAMHRYLSKITGNAELEILALARHSAQLDQDRPNLKSTSHSSSARDGLARHSVITLVARVNRSAVNPPLLQINHKNPQLVPTLYHHSEGIQVADRAHLPERPIVLQHGISVR
jgi:hypothetical protein